MRPPAARQLDRSFDAEVVVLSAGDREQLLARAEQLRRALADREDLTLLDLAFTLSRSLPDAAGARLAIVATSIADLEGKLARALRLLADPGCHRIEDPSGIALTDRPLHAPGTLGFVFPGLGAQYVNMLADLCAHFPEVRAGFDLMDQAFARHKQGSLPSQAIFPPPGEPADPAALWAMDHGTAAVSTANQALLGLLSRLGIRPHAVLGHSAGVFSALRAAGAVRIDDEAELIRQALLLIERLHREGRIPTGALLAVGAPEREQALALVHRSEGALTVAMDNSPRQVVLGGSAKAVAAAASELQRAGVPCAALPLTHPYHTSRFAEFSGHLHGLYAQVAFSPPLLPLYSCVTAARCPDDPEAVRGLVADQWSHPVRFREAIEAMHADGVRIFVEVGPRGSLATCIDDILRGVPHLAVPANVTHRTGVTQLAHLLGLLAAHHVPMDLAPLYAHRSPRPLSLGDGREAPPHKPAHSPRAQAMRAYLGTMDRFLDLQRHMALAVLGAGSGERRTGRAPNAQPPLLGSVVSLVEGRELIAVRRLDLEEDLFLADHTFGRQVSETDEALLALPVVPFTISMELLAEAALALLPGHVVIGMRNIRAYQWIALEDGHATLRVTARRDPTRDGCQVKGELWRLAGGAAGAEGGTRIAEGTVVLASAYPPRPAAMPLTLRGERPYAHGAHGAQGEPGGSAGSPYVGRMFHGPRFQGVVSLDRWGQDGIEATLETLPATGLFASTPDPTLVLDPQLLDAAAQLTGFWAAEHPGVGSAAFPFALAELQLFGPTLPAGQRVTGRARISSVTGQQARSDIDLAGPGGHLLARLIGWAYRRVELPRALSWLMGGSPRDAGLGVAWTALTGALTEPGAFACCRIDDLPLDTLAAQGRIWQRALAHLVLSRRERAAWAALVGSDQRRSEWLLGRAAAKDAVRFLLRATYGIAPRPADVEIIPDKWGRPLAAGAWAKHLDRTPVVSLSHCEGVAVAIAGDGRRCQGIGLDLERIDRAAGAIDRLAFAPHERDLVAALDGPLHQEWALRLWCAKEAAGKALGRGIEHPTSLVAADLDPASGTIHIVAGDPPAPAITGPLAAHTIRDGDWIAAVAIR